MGEGMKYYGYECVEGKGINCCLMAPNVNRLLDLLSADNPVIIGVRIFDGTRFSKSCELYLGADWPTSGDSEKGNTVSSLVLQTVGKVE